MCTAMSHSRGGCVCPRVLLEEVVNELLQRQVAFELLFAESEVHHTHTHIYT
jgi:hypothetical protein